MTYFLAYLAIGAAIGIIVFETIRSNDTNVRCSMALVVAVSALFWPYIVVAATYGTLKRK